MGRISGERIIFWTLPAVAIIWILAFCLFPGFLPPMSPTSSAADVARFYQEHTARVRYCMIGSAGAAPIAFLTSSVFWLLAAFRPDRAPDLTQMYNDLAWITFPCGV